MHDINRRQRFIVNTAYWAIVVGFIFLIMRYLLGLIWPFFLAFIFAWVQTPIIRWLTAKCHIKHSISVALCLLVFFAIVGGLIVVVLLNLVSWVQQLVIWLPSLYTGTIEPALRDGSVQLEEWAAQLSPDVSTVVRNIVSNVISSLGSSVTSFSMQAVGIVSGWIARLPSRLLSALICVIATVFMTVDFHRITAFVLRQFPEQTRHIIKEAKLTFVSVIKKYGRSYGIIMGITFCELLAGFLILRQDGAVLIAMLTAILDIFPVIGVGFILMPWALVSFIGGNIAKGVGLVMMYIIITVIRQIIEPRVVGHQVGLHPLVTLIAMLVGTKLFGGIGLLGLPIACAIIKSLDDTGVIHVIRKDTPAPARVQAPSSEKN